MTTLIFDIETNGFLDVTDRLHCLVIKDAATREVWSCRQCDIEDDTHFTVEHGLELLMQADILVGHNIIGFDIPAIQKIYPWFKLKAGAVMHDTMILSRLFWPDIKYVDDAKKEANPNYIPPKLRGSYKLEAFGFRLGILKSVYDGGWDEWSPSMQSYCEQDVEVTEALYRKSLVRWGHIPDWLKGQAALPENYTPYSDECVYLEHHVQKIVMRQVARGFAFDERAAADLYMRLSARREELRTALQAAFPPFYRGKGKIKVPKKDNKKYGYWGEAPFQPVELVEFNPGNNHHLIDRLKKVRGWVPTDFTEKGQPTIDDSIISRLPYPEAPLISEYLMVNKRISQLAEGDSAWLRKVQNGRINGGVVTLGAVTRRMTHLDPNLAQVPSVDVPFGPECRALFIAGVGYVLVGCDADSLELRLLAGYMAAFDGGAYIETVLKGDKKIGTDMHSVNARALGLDPVKLYPVDGTDLPGREIAKTWFYAFIYGGGAEKLGWIMGKRGTPGVAEHWGTNKRTGAVEDLVAKKAGTKSKKNFMEGLPALGKLVDAVRDRLKSRGFLLALDGGKLFARSPHSALNTLLQSAGAIVMKKALVLLDEKLISEGFVPGTDYEFVVNVHDEWQIEVLPQHVTRVKAIAEESIRLAGEFYSFACPLAGNADDGANWAETH
jgi:DNA polymerase-1